MRAPVSTVIAIVAGVITLAGYFIPLPVLQNTRTILLQWSITLAGVAGLVAIFHLLRVHWQKLTGPEDRDYTSLFMLLAFILTFSAGMMFRPDHPSMQKVVTHVQVPVEASLMGVLAISLIVAAVRFFQLRRGLMATVFVISTVLFLVTGSGVLTGLSDIPLLKSVLAGLNALPVAGARGILLGIALGSLTTGLRILTGTDRPYGG